MGLTRGEIEPDSNRHVISLAQIHENIPFQAKQKQNRLSFHREMLDPDRVHQFLID